MLDIVFRFVDGSLVRIRGSLKNKPNVNEEGKLREEVSVPGFQSCSGLVFFLSFTILVGGQGEAHERSGMASGA